MCLAACPQRKYLEAASQSKLCACVGDLELIYQPPANTCKPCTDDGALTCTACDALSWYVGRQNRRFFACVYELTRLRSATRFFYQGLCTVCPSDTGADGVPTLLRCMVSV
jgi:hypothetical protein